MRRMLERIGSGEIGGGNGRAEGAKGTLRGKGNLQRIDMKLICLAYPKKINS